MGWKDTVQEEKPVSWRETVATDESGSGVSPIESGIRGLAQGASLGFADEITGGFEALGDVALGDKTLSDFGDVYAQRRDESRALYDEAKAANPKTYMGAEIGGGIATAFVPGLGALNAAKGAQIGTVMGKGALQGALTGLGGSSADDVKEMAADTAMGGTLGAIGGGLGYSAGKAIGGVTDTLADSKVGQYLLSKYKGLTGSVANKLDEIAEVQGARALGLERATQGKLGPDKTRAIGRQALDEDLLSLGANTNDLIRRNEALKSAVMDQRAAAYKTIDDAGASTFNPLEVATQVEQKVIGDMNPQYADTQELLKKLQPEIDNILSRGEGNISMAEGQNLVSRYGKKAKFDKTRPNETQEMLQDVNIALREALNKSAEDSAEKTGIQGLGQVVKDSNRKFSVAKEAENLLKKKQAREWGNKTLGLTDNIQGGSAIASGNPLWAIPIVAAKKVSEKYGNQTAAISADKLSKFVRESPQMLGKYRPVLEKAIQRGGTSVAVTHHLLQQKDPEYRMKMNGMEEEQ